METKISIVRASGFCISGAPRRNIRGWLLLAQLSAGVSQDATYECGFLEGEVFLQCEARKSS